MSFSTALIGETTINAPPPPFLYNIGCLLSVVKATVSCFSGRACTRREDLFELKTYNLSITTVTDGGVSCQHDGGSIW